MIPKHCFCVCVFVFRGSVIARIVGANTKDHNDIFHEEVKMWVYEEDVDGRKLTEIINTEHENVKYLKGYKIPDNVVSKNGRLKHLLNINYHYKECYVCKHCIIAYLFGIPWYVRELSSYRT